MQSQQMMSGGAYNGTVYEPFSNATPSEASNPAKAPGGPRKDQASGRNPGEVDPNAASNQSPIGEPWIMLLMALLFGGIIAIKKYKQSTKMETNMKITTMKSFNKTLLTLFVLLIFDVGDAWAGFEVNGGTFYFDNSKTQWDNVYMLIGKGTCGSNCDGNNYTNVYAMNRIGTTQLWEYSRNNSWGGASYIRFIACNWGEGQWGSGNYNCSSGYTKAYTSNYQFNAYQLYRIVPSSGDNNADITPNHEGTDVSSLNKTVTIKAKVKMGSGEYTEGASKGAISATSHTFNAYNECNNNTSGSVAVNATSGSIAVGYTEEVHLSVSSVSSGYEFVGWYDNSGKLLSSNATYNDYRTTTDATVYAYFAQTHTVNIPAGVHGTVAVTGGSTGNNTIGQNPVEITASSPIAGCYFAGWILEGGVSLAGGYSLTDATIKVTATGTGTVIANFASRYALRGSDKDNNYSGLGMPGWSDESYTLDYVADNDFRRTVSLKGNINGSNYYKFRLYDKVLKKNLGFKYSGSISLNGGECWLNDYDADVTFTLDGSDELTFKIVSVAGSGHVDLRVLTSDAVTTSHTVNFNSRNFFVDGTKTTATTGGTVTAVDWKNYTLTTGQKAKSGKAVVFTAAPVAGYTFAGWYSNEACTSPYEHDGSGVIIDNVAKTLTLTINANKTVYAKFTENSTEVYLATRGSGKIEVETSTGVWTEAKDLTPTARTINVGVHTTYNIRATAASGNYFAKWDKVAVTYDFQIDDDEEENYGEDNPSGVLKGKGTGLGTQMLYANFYELDKIYFRNVNASTGNKLWTNVYVYFDVTWSGDCAVSAATTDASYIAQMTEKSDTKVYWAYVPRAFTRKVGDNSNGCVAFSDTNFGNNGGAGYKFFQHEGLKWASYTKSLDMCVPTQSDYDYDYTRTNQTKYYKSYWKKSYDYEGFLGGYTLKQYSGSGYSSVPNSNFKIVDINTIRTTFYIKNATKTYDFMIESAGGLHYITQNSPGREEGKDVYANACSAVTMTEWNSGSPRFTVHPNMEGEYTLTIDQSGEKMKLTVEYPVSVGDYRIKHTYNSGAKTTYSNAVKAAKVADTDTVSLFLSNLGTPSTVLQKCTSINADTKMPVWTDQNSTNLGDFNTQNPGVYKAGITVTNDAVSNTPVVEAYTGNYYIHVNAKTKNYLTTDGYPRSGNSVGTKFTKFVKNSKLGDTYDYYWVDWFQKVNDSKDAEKVTEAQSVVATIGNDYNIDLAGELGDDAYSVEGKTTTDGANVRYGYDSKSNTFTRAMITGAGSSIKIINNVQAGDVKILRKDGDPATDADWEDAYNTERSAQDADNWMYTFRAKVKEGSTATTTSEYNSQSMTLADNQKLLGGEGVNVYTVDVMYDFKTNRLITAWVPDPEREYTEPISLESNLMVVRREAGSPTLLNLVVDPEDDSKEGGLLKVKQVYTVMEFTKANWANSAWTTTGGGYKDAYFWISLPYDCYVSDIFGIPNYGSEDGSYWVLQTYRGDLRAEKGWWAETESWWYDMDRDDIMKANQGYVIRMTNLDDLGKPFHEDGDIGTLRLYFPSANPDELTVRILKSDTVINFPEIKCTIVRDSTNHAGDPNYDRRAIDSNWRIIGSPCFNSAKISTTGWGETYPTSPDVKGNLQFFYTWSLDGEGKPKYTIQNASAVSAFEFKATHAYFVQYAGNITWTNYSTTPFVGFRVPERAQEATEQTLQLVLNKNGEQADVTYIKRMEEGATEEYDLNKDLSKVMNGRMANLYTIAGYYKMGGNCLPDTTSIVPVGVRTAVAGEYTFSMPEGTNGTGVYLIDNVAGTRTNLALTDYTVNLAAGTYDGRFMLELSPIAQTPTDVEHTSADGMNGVHKVMVDGILYIVKDGKVFDARGNRVQ